MYMKKHILIIELADITPLGILANPIKECWKG